jgi:site-specific DNA-adenine methylase
MKNLLVLLLLFIGSAANAQNMIYIDHTYQSMKESLTEDGNYIDKEEDYNDQLVVTLFSHEHQERVGLLFYKNGECITNAIFYNDMPKFNAAIEDYNKHFVVLSNKSWRVYAKGNSYHASIETTSKNKFYILWTKE